MELMIITLSGIFVWLVANHPQKDWDVNFNDKYNYYLKQFKDQNRE